MEPTVNEAADVPLIFNSDLPWVLDYRIINGEEKGKKMSLSQLVYYRSVRREYMAGCSELEKLHDALQQPNNFIGENADVIA